MERESRKFGLIKLNLSMTTRLLKLLSFISFFFLLTSKEEPAPKTSKMTSSSNPSDADHAEDATPGISDGGIILLLCMNLSSIDNKSMTYFSHQLVAS